MHKKYPVFFYISFANDGLHPEVPRRLPGVCRHQLADYCIYRQPKGTVWERQLLEDKMCRNTHIHWKFFVGKLKLRLKPLLKIIPFSYTYITKACNNISSTIRYPPFQSIGFSIFFAMSSFCRNETWDCSLLLSCHPDINFSFIKTVHLLYCSTFHIK